MHGLNGPTGGSPTSTACLGGQEDSGEASILHLLSSRAMSYLNHSLLTCHVPNTISCRYLLDSPTWGC